MTVDDALRAAAGLVRRDAGTVLPYYALLAATADVARLPLLAGVIVVYLLLASGGRLDPLVDDLAGLNPELLAPDTPAGLPPELGERLATTLASPTVVGPLVVAVGVAVVCYVLARGVTRSAALAAVDAGIDGRDPLGAGVDGTRRWRTFAGLVVVRWGLVVVAGLPALAALAGGVGTLGTASGAGAALDRRAAGAVLAALAGVVVTAVAVLVVLGLLAFAGPAAVVDGVGLGGALRRSVGVPFAHPGGFVLYGVVVVAGYVVLGVGAALLGVAGVGRIGALVSTFLLTPLLDGIAVALYAGWTDGRAVEVDDGSRQRDGAVGPGAAADESGFVFGRDRGTSVEGDRTEEIEGDRAEGVEGDRAEGVEGDRAEGVEGDRAEEAAGDRVEEVEGVEADADGTEWDDAADLRDSPGVDRRDGSGLRGGLRDGVAELGDFVRRDWGYVVAAAVVLAAGVVGGWRATAGYGVRIGAPDDPGAVFGAVPVGPFVDIAVNNWLVATSAGFSGLFAGLPTVGTLLFNGLLVGAVAGVVDPLVFASLVGPHAVVELPAIAVAGGVGLRLGHVAWGAWWGSRPRTALVDEIARTWRVVVGLAVVFVVAGFVEAFVTPQVAGAVLG